MLVSEIPALVLTTKRRWFLAQHSLAHDRRRCEPLGRFGGKLALEKKLGYVPLRCHFLRFEMTVDGK